MCEEDFGHVLSCWIFLISAWLWELDSTPYPVPYLRFGTKWFTKAICFVKPGEETEVDLNHFHFPNYKIINIFLIFFKLFPLYI